MSFWENVEKELIFYGKTKKELSILTGINLQSLHKAFERKSTVSAENAVKIAQALNVTVEYLVTGEISPVQNQKTAPKITDEELNIYKQNYELIKKIVQLPPESKNIISQLADQIKSP